MKAKAYPTTSIPGSTPSARYTATPATVFGLPVMQNHVARLGGHDPPLRLHRPDPRVQGVAVAVQPHDQPGRRRGQGQAGDREPRASGGLGDGHE